MAEDAKKVPAPAEPADAGSKTRRAEPPIWPEGYDTSDQPNQPENLTPPVDQANRRAAAPVEKPQQPKGDPYSGEVEPSQEPRKAAKKATKKATKDE